MHRGKVVGGIVGAGIWGLVWLGRGTFEAWFFDRVLDMAQPHWSWAIEYGPPAVLAAITIWLLWSGTHQSDGGARLALSRLRGRGAPIRNEIQQSMTDTELESWIASTRAWMDKVARELRKISEEDAEWFLTLDTVPPARVPIPNIRLGGGPQRAAFESHFRQHDYRLARLDQLLQKYGVGVAVVR